MKPLPPAADLAVEIIDASKGDAWTKPDHAERTGLTQSDIRHLFKRHGGDFHGPHVEHANIEEQAFYRFTAELILNERRAAIDAMRDAAQGQSEQRSSSGTVNPNQVIFDAITASTRIENDYGGQSTQAIIIDTKKFIEVFNNHRDRALCTSINGDAQAPSECSCKASDRDGQHMTWCPVTINSLLGGELARWCYDNPNLAARTIEGLRGNAQPSSGSEDAKRAARIRNSLQAAKDVLRHYVKIDYDANNQPQPNAAFDVEQMCKEALYEIDLASADLVTDWEDVEQLTNVRPLSAAQAQQDQSYVCSECELRVIQVDAPQPDGIAQQQPAPLYASTVPSTLRATSPMVPWEWGCQRQICAAPQCDCVVTSTDRGSGK